MFGLNFSLSPEVEGRELAVIGVNLEFVFPSNH